MKYYKNLIRRKKYGVLTLCLITFLIGVFTVYHNFLDILIRSITWSDLSDYAIYNN